MIDTLFTLFDKYGWEGIIGIAVLASIYFGGQFLFKKLSKLFNDDISTGFEKVGTQLTDQMSKQNDKLVETIVSQQSKLIDHMLTHEETKKTEHKDLINNRIKLAEEVNVLIKDIMHIEGAQRAFIIEFHNSYMNLSGMPFAKYSVTYEWFEQGLMPIGQICNALPFSQIAKIVSDLINSKTQQVVYEDMDQMREESPTMSRLLEDRNITKVVYEALYDSNNQIIGAICIEYHKPLEEIHTNLTKFDEYCVKIESIINLKYKYISAMSASDISRIVHEK